MATTNPRITVTLRPEVHAVLRRLSGLAETSQSAIVGDLLASSLHVFERMAEALEAAHRLKSEGMRAPDAIRESLERAQHKLEGQLDLALGQMDEAVRPLLQEAEKVNRRAGAASGAARRSAAAKARPAAPTPVPVTRGSGHPHGPEKGGATHQASSPKTTPKKVGKGGRRGTV
jgi:hypothetical protein